METNRSARSRLAMLVRSRRVRQRARPHLARRAVEGHTNDGIGPGPLETDLVDQAIAERLGSGVPDEPDETNPRLLWAGQLDAICDGPRRLQHDARERRIGAQAELIERHRRRRTWKCRG